MSFDQTGPGGLGNLGGSKLTLGSLAQSARTKQIRQARNILYFVGGLNLIVGVLFFLLIGNAKGPQAPNPEAIRGLQVVVAVFMAVGTVFIVLGMLTKRYPVPATMLGLIIYTTLTAINLIGSAGNLNVFTLIIPILIEIALIRSVRSAIAYQRELNASKSMADPLS